jgi:regulator of protease activity HflC (stomatin/prohibitin superfamily)
MSSQFIKVYVEYQKYFDKSEFDDFEAKFKTFDEDSNGFIDFFELKRAQEKMGKAKTHLELTEMMKSMATDPKQGISYRDFVRVQLKAKGIDPDTASPYKASTLEMNFAKEVTDFTVKGIKKFHEDQAKKFEAEKEQERMIKAEREERARRQREKREAEEKKRRERAAFQQKARELFEQAKK